MMSVIYGLIKLHFQCEIGLMQLLPKALPLG
jgi:hypothetical protein